MAELPEKAFKAILIGATGATGKLLFTELVKARVSLNVLICFMPLIPFETHCKHQETSVFQMFSGDIERGQWYKMG